MMEHDLQSGLDDEQGRGGEPGPDVPLVAGYQRLEDAILDECFPEVDLALRRGRHIHKGDEAWFRFLSEAQGLLEPFYRRYGCELEQRSDGYFFLLPVSDGLGKRHLGVPEMIVGQGLALCYLDPQSVQSGGVVTREELLNQLAAVMGTDALMNTLNPKRKRVDERVMQRTVRQKVNEALRRLSLLGFVELLDAEQLRLAPSLMRFAEPVRGLDAPSEALKRLIERGEVSLGPGDVEPRDGEEELDEAEDGVDASEASAAAGTSAAGDEGIDADPHEALAADLRADADFSFGDPHEALAADLHADADSSFGADPHEAADLGADADSSFNGDPGAPPDSAARAVPEPIADPYADLFDDVGADPDARGLESDDASGAARDETLGLDSAALREQSLSAGGEAGATAEHGEHEPASESPPRPALASPTGTYEGFPANDRGHAAEDDDEAGGGADHGRGELDGAGSASIDGASHDGPWGDDTARTAGTDRSTFEHGEIDFHWDTVPDEEA